MQRSVGSSHIFIDAANGKHIGIIHPWKSGTEFYHYTGFYSIALFAFVDFDYKFFYAEVGMAVPLVREVFFAILTFTVDLRKTCLAFPLQGSSLRVTMTFGTQMTLRHPNIFCADDPFPLSVYCMKHYRNAKKVTPHKCFLWNRDKYFSNPR